jgi:hypothetical protein
MLHCMREKCSGEAIFSVKTTVSAQDHKFFECPPLVIYSNLRLCDSCVEKIKLKDIFTEDMKDLVRFIMFEHNALPDFQNSQLQIISTDDIQLLMLEANDETKH